MKISFLVLALTLTSAGVASAHTKTSSVEEPSLGLQAAKRVVRAQQIADRLPARALGWSTWMVQKYKKSANYQNEQQKAVRN